ncbi:MAG: hypothetical protein WD770_09655, partial [Actinomycetota bacterium]
MRVLRRVLYVQAATSVVIGLLLAALPRFVLVQAFDQLPLYEYAWVRIVGIQLLAAAMFAVLVAQRVEDLWFWGWAFAIPTALGFLVFGATAAVGLECTTIDGVDRCPESLLWWILAAVTGLLSLGYVLGLAP